MPLGVVCAQVTHAAGDSAVGYTLFEWYDQPVTAVVLGVKSEKELLRYSKKLHKAFIGHTIIKEDAGPVADQYTAIGLVTADREKVFKVLKKLNPISELI
jgi:peptidyl-tRNA hydrolase